VSSTSNPIPLNITGGAATSVAVSTQAAHGTATASGTSITYTPTSGYTGSDSFQYTATNASGTSTAATASILVSAGATTFTYDDQGRLASAIYSDGTAITYGYDAAGNRTQVGGAAVANAVSASVTENSTNNPIPLNITGGPAASVAVSTQATHGTATASGNTIAYTPTSGYVGSDSFQYTATNAAGTSSAATATITVNLAAPIANPVSATVAQNSTNNPVPLSLTGGAATSAAVSTQAAHGTATASGTSITYTPANGYSGADSFQYTATNAAGTSTAATATITVNGFTPVTHTYMSGSGTETVPSGAHQVVITVWGGGGSV
jgi:large repetitive protein